MKMAKILDIRLFFVIFGVGFLVYLAGCNKSFRTSSYELRGQGYEIISLALADDSPRVRTKAIEVAASTKQIDLMVRIDSLLSDDCVPVRFAAAQAIGDVGYAASRRKIQLLLENDPDENVRIAAAYTLNKMGETEMLDIIKKAISSTDQTVRANAVVLLGKSGDKESLKALYWVMKDDKSDSKTSLQAAEAIARLGDETIYPQLWTMLISVYTFDRVMGVKAMGALGNVEARGALISMLGDETLEVRLAAAEQLGGLGDASGEPEVLDVFKKKVTAGFDEKQLEGVKVSAALAIGQIATPALTRYLPQLLESRSKIVRLAAAKAVFQFTSQN